MTLAIALVGLVLALAVGVFAILIRDSLLQLRAEYQHLARTLGRLVDDVDLVRGAESAVPAPLEQLRQRWNGIAPAPAWGPPVDESIPTSAKLPERDPGDVDNFEIEERVDGRPLSATPPES